MESDSGVCSRYAESLLDTMNNSENLTAKYATNLKRMASSYEIGKKSDNNDDFWQMDSDDNDNDLAPSQRRVTFDASTPKNPENKKRLLYLPKIERAFDGDLADLWVSTIEHSFQVHGIHDEDLKLEIGLNNIAPKFLCRLQSYLKPENRSWQNLKLGIKNVFTSKSIDEKFSEVLNDISLNDNGPSDLMTRILNALNISSDIDDDVMKSCVRHIFINKLPPMVRIAAAAVGEANSLDSIARTADRVFRQARYNGGGTDVTTWPTENKKSDQTDMMNRLNDVVKAMNKLNEVHKDNNIAIIKKVEKLENKISEPVESINFTNNGKQQRNNERGYNTQPLGRNHDYNNYANAYQSSNLNFQPYNGVGSQQHSAHQGPQFPPGIPNHNAHLNNENNYSSNNRPGRRQPWDKSGFNPAYCDRHNYFGSRCFPSFCNGDNEKCSFNRSRNPFL